MSYVLEAFVWLSWWLSWLRVLLVVQVFGSELDTDTSTEILPLLQLSLLLYSAVLTLRHPYLLSGVKPKKSHGDLFINCNGEL